MSERKLAVTRLPLQWLLCLALLGSCSGLTEPSGSNAEVGESSSGDLVPATSSEVSAAGIDPPVVERSVEPMTLAEIFYKGHAIVEGDVVEVGKLKWNQESGEPWTLADSPEAFAEPQAYRVARLEHVKVTRSDDRADGLVGGDSVQVTFPVDFESDGSEVPVGGGFAKGDHVVVALYYGFLAEREGYVDHLYPVGHELGVFFRSVDGDYQRRITTYPVLGSGDAALVESPAFVAAEADPISQAALVNLIELSRLTDVPGWDRDRQGVSAAEKEAEIEALLREQEDEAEALRRDPENVCNWVGNEDWAAQWVARHPEEGFTVDQLMDPSFVDGACHGFVYEGPTIDRTNG